MINTTVNATNLDYRTGTREPAADANRAVRRASAFDRESLAAFAIYCGLSLLFFGRGLIGHFGDRYIGVGPDPAPALYLMLWWPHALANLQNPFFNRLVWAPEAINYAHFPCLLSPALLMSPLTLLAGPIVSYNALVLLSTALSAWAAFILFRYLCGAFGAAVAGGALFGYSPFALSHALGQAHLVMGAFIPLAIYATLRRLSNEISARRFFVWMTLIIAGQIGFALEMLALGTLLGAVALALAWLMGGADLRRRIVRLAAPLAASYCAAVLLAAPYIYYFFAGGALDFSPNIALHNSAMPSNFILPTQVNLFGAWMSRWLAARTPIYDTTAYVGAPALLLIAIVAARRSGEIAVKMCVAMLIILATLSLGPVLLTGPHRGIPMPEAFLYFYAPLFKNALPVRFTAFFFICIGAILALWLGDRSRSAAVRWGFGALILLSLTPNLNASFWSTNVDTPGFFRNGLYRKYISPGETIMILPYGITGTSDVWQADARHFFRTAGGYLSVSPPVPRGYRDWPAVRAFFGLYEIPDLRRNVAAFLVGKQVSKVLVPDGGAHLLQWTFGDGPASWRLRAFSPDENAAIDAFFGWLDPAPLRVGGVTIYRIPLDRLKDDAQDTPAALQLATGRAFIQKLLTAANSYLADGGDLANLNLISGAARGLLPRLWLTGASADNYLPQLENRNGLTLKATDNGLIEVGITGTAGALQQIAREYKAYTVAARVMPPEPALNVADWVLPVLQMRFDREGLARAAAYAARQEASAAANASEPREKGAFAGVHD